MDTKTKEAISEVIKRMIPDDPDLAEKLTKAIVEATTSTYDDKYVDGDEMRMDCD